MSLTVAVGSAFLSTEFCHCYHSSQVLSTRTLLLSIHLCVQHNGCDVVLSAAGESCIQTTWPHHYSRIQLILNHVKIVTHDPASEISVKTHTVSTAWHQNSSLTTKRMFTSLKNQKIYSGHSLYVLQIFIHQPVSLKFSISCHCGPGRSLTANVELDRLLSYMPSPTKTWLSHKLTCKNHIRLIASCPKLEAMCVSHASRRTAALTHQYNVVDREKTSVKTWTMNA